MMIEQLIGLFAIDDFYKRAAISRNFEECFVKCVVPPFKMHLHFK